MIRLCTQAVHLIITVSIFLNFELSLFKSSTVALLPSLLKHFYFSFIFFFSGSVSAIFDLRIFSSRQVSILVSHFHSGTGGFEGSCGAFFPRFVDSTRVFLVSSHGSFFAFFTF